MFDIIPRALLIDEIIHGLVSLPFAYLVWKKSQNWKMAVSVVILTYAIDSDHLIDYFLHFGLSFSLKEFFSLTYFTETNRALVLFHAWEWILVLGLIVRKKGWNSRWGVLLAALLPHIVYDTTGVGSVLFYSILFRVSSGFILP